MITLEEKNCTLCGPKAKKRVKYAARFDPGDLNPRIFSARRSPDRRHFRFVECGNCGIIYSDPACNFANLAGLYQDSLVTYSDQEASIFASYTPVLDRALMHLSHRGTFVEIGGGRGFMLRYGADRGFAQQIEIEPSAAAQNAFVPASEQARFVRSMFVDGTLQERSASLICFFQVIDHVPDPYQFTQNVFVALQPGGVAVTVTHNTAAWSARLLGERSPIYDIEHTYLFNTENISRLFEKVGFAHVEAFPVSNEYSVRHWLHIAPAPQLAKRMILRGLSAVGVADKRIPLAAGNMAVIARKPLSTSAM